MRGRSGRSAATLVVVLCAAMGAALGVPGQARGATTGLVVVGQWGSVVPADTVVAPMVAVDSPARVGYVLSGSSRQTFAASDSNLLWNRVQPVSLSSGRPIAPLSAVPPLDVIAPVLVDQRRHLLIYPQRPLVGGATTAYASAPVLVGIGLRDGVVKVLFQVTTRLPPGVRVAGLTLDDSGSDLVVAGTLSPGSTVSSVRGVGAITLDRMSIAGLLANKVVSGWTTSYQLPPTLCPELIESHQEAGLLLAGGALSMGCRPSTTPIAITLPSTGQPAGVLTLTGLTSTSPPTATSFAPAPGAFGGVGESYADRLTRRLVLADYSIGGEGARVFDQVHGRYVGMIKAGAGLPDGITGDPSTGRVYFAGTTPSPGIGGFDLAPVVPTQGFLDRNQFSGLEDLGTTARLSFDSASRTLLVPSRNPGANYFVLLVADRVPAYSSPSPFASDLGALDVVDRPGVTDSTRSAAVHAFGADYQLVGGTANLVQNGAGPDSQGELHPGTRALRQAYVRSATLGGEGSTAQAVVAQEDAATDADRNGVKPQTNGLVDAGSTFVAGANCSDFGSSPSGRPVVVLTAQVFCNAGKERTLAQATYSGVDGVFMTTQGHAAPVALPVQVGNSHVEVTEGRGPDRGALQSTVTATAENVTVLNTVHIGRVTSSVTVSAHGRHGTAIASAPVVSVVGVSVDGTPLCSLTCPLGTVESAVNTALGSRGRVTFPTGRVIQSPGGTFASYAQDPWYHAERLLDYDKADDDYAVPAMTIVVNLEGATKSRLVVDLAALDASASYRIFALGSPLAPRTPGNLPGVLQRLPGSIPPATQALPGMTRGAAGLAPALADTPPAGFVSALVRSLRFALRSPTAAAPVILIWALLALAPYLAARRRLLLELPMLTREQDLA